MRKITINPHFIAILAVCFILITILYPSIVLGAIKSPFNSILEKNKNTALINDLVDKNPQIVNSIKTHPELLNALITNDTANITVYTERTVLVTPTPDGRLYFAGEYQNGTRLLAHPFSIYRSGFVNNVNENSSLKISTNVYSYAIFPKLTVFNPEYTNSPSGLGYNSYYPSTPDKQFLILFVSIYTDDIISINSGKVCLPDENNFVVQIGDNIYYPYQYPKQMRIKELETKTNIGDNSFIQAFGQHEQYEMSNGIDKDYSSETYGEYIQNGIAGENSIEHYYIPMGYSNVENGYIIYEIPQYRDIEDITVLFNFFAFGNSGWKLYTQSKY